jgi:hypothetical protein
LKNQPQIQYHKRDKFVIKTKDTEVILSQFIQKQSTIIPGRECRKLLSGFFCIWEQLYKRLFPSLPAYKRKEQTD